MNFIEVEVGRFRCAELREFLERQRFLGAQVDWFEGRGFFSRTWLIRGPDYILRAIEHDIAAETAEEHP